MSNQNTDTTHKIKICMGSSCFARGNQSNLDLIELFIDNHKLNAEIELVGSRCENRCSNGPNIEIDGKLHNHVDSASLIDLLNSIVLSNNLKNLE